MRIRTGDEVKVIAGVDKGTVAEVLRTIPDADKVVVKGVNLVYKHVRPSQKNQKGGRVSKEMPVHVSNVMLMSKAANRPTRVGVRFTAEGQKERYCKVTGASLGNIGAPKPRRAAGASPATTRTTTTTTVTTKTK
jgi:large subunit ribosomal protein L24